MFGRPERRPRDDSRGRPLEPTSRTEMESAFGADFGSVRIRTDPDAGRQAARLGAGAVTSGDEILFAPGRFDSRTTAGRHLLAHELAHVVQQRSGTREGIGPAGGSHERAAGQAAASVTAGRKARVGGSGPAPAVQLDRDEGDPRPADAPVADRPPPRLFPPPVKELEPETDEERIARVVSTAGQDQRRTDPATNLRDALGQLFQRCQRDQRLAGEPISLTRPDPVPPQNAGERSAELKRRINACLDTPEGKRFTALAKEVALSQDGLPYSILIELAGLGITGSPTYIPPFEFAKRFELAVDFNVKQHSYSAVVTFKGDPSWVDTAVEGAARGAVATGKGIAGAAVAVVGGVAAGAGFVGRGVAAGARAVGSGVAAGVRWLIGAARTAGRGIAAGARAVGSGIAAGARAVGSGIASAARWLAGAARTVGGGIAAGARAVGTAARAVGSGIASAARFVGRGIAAGARAVAGAAGAVWNGITWVAGQFWDKTVGILQRLGTWIDALPTRVGRLLSGLWEGVRALRPWSLDWWKSLGSVSTWTGLLKWLGHRFIDLVDVVGLGEAYETVMDFVKFNTRTLTSAEIASARKIFGGTIALDRVRLDERAVLGPAFSGREYTSFHTINGWGSIDDDVLLHELTHVWQYEQAGAIYMPQAIHAQKWGAGYNYGGAAGLRAAQAAGDKFSSFNREQQAQIVQDFSKLRRGDPDARLYAGFVAEVSTLTPAQLVAGLKP
jgi:Domain of unknown function (DUF4157)